MSEKKTLLVVFHLYYHQQLDYYLGKLANIEGYDWDLLVTYSVADETSEKKLKAFKPGVKLLKVENAGYDIWPFIAAVKYVNLDDYEYIMKIHTKNANLQPMHINGLNLTKYMWRSLLINSFLKTPEQFRKAILRLEMQPSAGMLCSRELYTKMKGNLPEEGSVLRRELGYLGIEPHDKHFCAGTMFIAKAECFRILQRAGLNAEYFHGEMSSHSTGSPAHAYERILPILVTENGYKIIRQGSNFWFCVTTFFHCTFTPVIENIFALNRMGEERHKYLVVFGLRFKIAE